MKAIWYLDDFGVKHFTVVQSQWEYDIFKERYSFVSEIKTNEIVDR